MRAVAIGRRLASHAIGAIENRGFDFTSSVRDPPVQFRSADAYQSAGHVQPNVVILVLNQRVDRVARQAVRAVECGNMIIFDPAQAASGCGPERPVRIELKAAANALAQSLGACIRCADLTVCELRLATQSRPTPQPTLPV